MRIHESTVTWMISNLIMQVKGKFFLRLWSQLINVEGMMDLAITICNQYNNNCTRKSPTAAITGVKYWRETRHLHSPKISPRRLSFITWKIEVYSKEDSLILLIHWTNDWTDQMTEKCKDQSTIYSFSDRCTEKDTSFLQNPCQKCIDRNVFRRKQTEPNQETSYETTGLFSAKCKSFMKWIWRLMNC